MMTSDFIIDVDEVNFEYEVISYSLNVPVVVEFWAEWCRPCKPLGANLEKLAREAQGAFRLARVDVEASPNLTIHYNVRSIPAVKAFSSGEVVAEFSGNLPIDKLREFISRIEPPGQSALDLEHANNLLSDQEWAEAEDILRDVLEVDPDNANALLGLGRALIGQGKPVEALSILTHFPTSREFVRAEKLAVYARALAALTSPSPDEETSDLDAAYRNALQLASRGKIAQALDGLLDVLRLDKNSQPIRAAIIGLLELLGDDNSLSHEYRKELASVLF